MSQSVVGGGGPSRGGSGHSQMARVNEPCQFLLTSSILRVPTLYAGYDIVVPWDVQEISARRTEIEATDPVRNSASRL